VLNTGEAYLPTSKILGEAAIAPQCRSAESNTNAAALDSADQRTRPQGVDTALVPLEVAFFGSHAASVFLFR
jgi:hypothetical protein